MIYQKKGLNKILSKLVNLIQELFTNHIVVNACLFYNAGKVMHRNWGDDINYFFLKKLFKKNIICYDYSSIAHRTNKNNYLIIGSTLTLLCNKKSIVWGAGVIDPKTELPAKPKKVLAVRGPLTRKYLLEKGVECPKIYGDPALLLPLFYSPSIKKRYKIGLIPHYSDYDSPILNKLKQNSEILFIKMEGYKKWTDVIDYILSCEYIVSSSLHGIIIAESYNIPNLWAEIDGELLGGHFKFHDFFLSIKRDRNKPYKITEETTSINLLKELNLWQQGDIELNPLIKASPFKIHLK